MMRIIIFSVCLIGNLISNAQIDIESRITRRVDCEDVSYFAFENIPDYYQKEQIDSIQQVVEFWSTKCPLSQVFIATQSLLKIQNGFVNDIDEKLFNDLTSFSEFESERRIYRDEIINSDNSYNHVREEYLIYDRYVQFIMNWADDLLKTSYNLCSDQHRILLCYSGNSEEFFQWLDKDCQQSKLSEIYKNQINKYLEMPDTDAGLFVEYWEPQGNLGLLGTHPGIGGYIGSRRNWGFYRGTMALRFLPSENAYFAKDRGIVEETNHFFGGYFMFHTGLKVLSIGSFHNYLVGGIGIDIMDVLKSNPNDQGSGKSIASFNPTIGWSTRANLLKSNYFAIEAEYNFLSYVNRGGTDLSGSALSLKLIYGWLWNYNKDRNLRLLRHQNTKSR